MLLPYATERIHRSVPWTTYSLVALNILVHVMVMAGGPENYERIVDQYAYVSNRPSALYTMFTMMFLHAPGLWHLLFNMLFLGIFGPQVEDALGHAVFLVFYVVSNVGACLLYTVMLRASGADPTVPALGASGAVAGVLGMFAMRFYSTSVRTLLLFFIPLRVPSVIFLGIWMGSEIRTGLLDAFVYHGTSGVANWAHIGGFVFGVIAGLVLGVVTDARKEYAIERPIESEDDRRRVVGVLRGVLRQLGDDPDANYRLATLLDASPTEARQAAEHYARAVRGFARTRRPQLAVQAYRDFAQTHAFSEMPAAVHRLAGACFEESGDEAGARWVYDYIGQHSSDAEEVSLALVRSAQIAQRAGDHAGARAALARVVQDFSGTEWADHARRLLSQL